MSLKGRLRASFRELADLAQYKLSKWKLQFLTSSAYKRYYVCKQSSYLSIYLINCPTNFFHFQGLASRLDGEGLWTIPPDWIPWVLGAFGAILLIAVGVLAYLIAGIRRELATRFRLGRLFALFNSLLAFPLILFPLVTIWVPVPNFTITVLFRKFFKGLNNWVTVLTYQPHKFETLVQ